MCRWTASFTVQLPSLVAIGWAIAADPAAAVTATLKEHAGSRSARNAEQASMVIETSRWVLLC
jgi:hypothetical protein